jgi:hypothetical protein
VRVRIDGDLKSLRAMLSNAQRDVEPESRKVLIRAAYNIKRDAQRKVSDIAHAPHYPRAIGYDVAWLAGFGVAEIGPDKRKVQGALGNILEYGTRNNPPYAHLGPALDYEAPAFERYLGQLGEDLLT